jgi:hypothetical protein
MEEDGLFCCVLSVLEENGTNSFRWGDSSLMAVSFDIFASSSSLATRSRFTVAAAATC